MGLLLFIPIGALKRHRSLAKRLSIGGAVAFVAALILTPTPPKETSTPAKASIAAASLQNDKRQRNPTPAEPVVSDSAHTTGGLVRLSGLLLEGGPADAKAAGFRSCTADYYHLKCQRRNWPIFDIVAPTATVLMDNPQEIVGPADPKVARYSGVSVTLSDKASVDQFFEKMQHAGWVEHSRRGATTLYYSGLSMTIGRGGLGVAGNEMYFGIGDPDRADAIKADMKRAHAEDSMRRDFVRDMAN
ncbi:MAG TPA: hypothetical protein VFO80_11760 [Sphingomonas sp.]|nr:hypothetical protein [Sphingomonas sp.]